jgi:excinuclease UvrABC nuclease subunit
LSNLAVSDLKPSTTKANSAQLWWLALTLTPGLGATRAKRLVEFFGSVDKVFEATLTELEAA